MSIVSIIGSGTWGTALANLLCKAGHDVTLWSAIPEEIDYIRKNHKHPNLKDTRILEDIKLTTSIQEAINQKEFLVMAVPSIYVRSTTQKIAPYLNNNQIIVDVAKGIESNTLHTMSEIILEEIQKYLPDYDYGHIVALSGPTHAEEVAIGLPSSIISASVDNDIAIRVQELFTTDFMRVYTNNDIKSVELCGALKNIIALGAGISHGLGYGDNATAALITRGIHEISRLGVSMGCPIYTFYGLAGVGDLIVTCTSLHSRNNLCGMYIGQGLSVKEAIDKVGMVVEGINALDAAYSLSLVYSCELPIIKGVYDIVKFNVDPKEMVRKLYNRKSKPEMPKSIIELSNLNEINKDKVFVFNVFDRISFEDIDLLNKAKTKDECIIVILPDDDFLEAYSIKHEHAYQERSKMVESLKMVDLIISIHSIDAIYDQYMTYHAGSLIASENYKNILDQTNLNINYVQKRP